MNKQKKSIGQRFLIQADLPAETLPRQPILELCGDQRVLIENHLGITEYGSERIQVRVKYGTICVEGENLRLCCMNGTQVVILGKIDAIHVIRRNQ